MVTVCSYVVFFSAFLTLAEDTVFHLLPADGILMACLRGSFELTAGISSLGTIFSTEYVKFVAAAFMLSFSAEISSSFASSRSEAQSEISL